ncbi:MAG: DHA2 family efflux MFS transporter permease subunit [Proteobacteria bacterium]|nr:DHA2 family efflux MFS transporter permease subunit [Pseudomonadota bacterium]
MSGSIPAADPADRPLLETRHTGLLMAALMGVSIVQFLDATIANVALPHMRASLGASPDTITWVLTSFIISGVLVLPLTGWLSDRIGSRNLFIGATAMFLLTSMLCGAATSLPQMVVFRALQGMAAAFLGPMSQTFLFDINRPSRQAGALSVWGATVMVAPISGPFIGGYLTDALNWRWVFYVNLPIGIPALAVLWWLLPSRPIVRRRLDIFGAVMLGTALVGMQLLLDRGHQNDWFESQESVIELLVALSALWIFLVHSRWVAHPLFKGEMVFNANFLGGLAFMVILGITNVGLSSVLPTLLESVYDYPVLTTGLLMAPRGIGLLLTMLLANRIIARIDGRWLISVGYTIAAFSLWTMTRWSIDMDYRPIVLSGLIQGLGLGLVFMPINLIAFAQLAPHYRTDGSTLMTLFRNIGSSFGISVIVDQLARNTQTSHSDIAGNVTSFKLPALDPATTAAQLGDFGAAMLGLLNGEVSRQAAFIAYLDSFYMLGWVLLAVVPLPWLLKRARGRPGERHVVSE